MREYRNGDILVGKVTGIKKYGIFVVLDNGQSGLIHISEISDKYISDVSSITCLGEYILVKVIGFDQGKVKLSIKDIEHRTKKASIKLAKPKISYDPNEFDALRKFLD